MTCEKAVFEKTQILRRIGKYLSAREGYKLWPRQPFRLHEERRTSSPFYAHQPRFGLKCWLQAPRGNKAVDGFCQTQQVG